MIKTITGKFLRQTATKVQCLQPLSSAMVQERLQSFRTSETDPMKHTLDHWGQFYKISHADQDRIFLYGGLPKSFRIQAKTFTETCLMVRKSSLDVINCLKAIDYSKPAVRFVIYGKMGSGKSLALAHIIHYAAKAGFLLVHLPWVGNWYRQHAVETSNSETREGFVDLNVNAAAWLLHFKNQNEELLKSPELKTSQEYVWSKREKTEIGAPLLSLVEHGINRVKFASDCVVFLAEEVKQLSRSGVIKTLVAIDGFNAFFHPKPRIFGPKKVVIHPSKITLTLAFLNLTKFDWTNAAIVVTVDEIAMTQEEHMSHLPRFLLGKDGFEHLDPFVPVLVENFNEKEMKSCLDYYRERRWITPTEGQDEELSFITANNPYRLMQVCASI